MYSFISAQGFSFAGNVSECVNYFLDHFRDPTIFAIRIFGSSFHRYSDYSTEDVRFVSVINFRRFSVMDKRVVRGLYRVFISDRRCVCASTRVKNVRGDFALFFTRVFSLPGLIGPSYHAKGGQGTYYGALRVVIRYYDQDHGLSHSIDALRFIKICFFEIVSVCSERSLISSSGYCLLSDFSRLSMASGYGLRACVFGFRFWFFGFRLVAYYGCGRWYLSLKRGSWL